MSVTLESQLDAPYVFVPGPMLDCDWRSKLGGADALAYNEWVVNSPSGHFAQTRGWTDVASLGRPFRSVFVLVRHRASGQLLGCAHVLRCRVGPLALPYAIIDRGPVVQAPKDLSSVLPAIVHAARRRGIAYLVVMPYWAEKDCATATSALEELGFRNVQKPDGAHCATLRLAVAGRPDEGLLHGPQAAKARREMHAAQRLGVVAQRSDFEGFDLLAQLHRCAMRAQGRKWKSQDWFRAIRGAFSPGHSTQAAAFVTRFEGRALAVVLAIKHGRLVTYVNGSSIHESMPFSKTTPAMLEAIKWARDEGCDFDLGGIPAPSDVDEKRKSIAQFKFGFGGTHTNLLGAYARWLW